MASAGARERRAAATAPADGAEGTRWAVAGLAHDLNNALFCVLGELDALSEVLAAARRASQPARLSEATELVQLLDRCSDSLGSIDAALRTATSHGRELQAVFQGGGAASGAARATRLSAAVQRSLSMSAPFLRDVQVSVSVGPCPVLVSEDALVRVLGNLLGNAWQTFSGMQGDRRIEIRAKVTGAHVICDVADNGPGVSPEILPRLFQYYATTKAAGHGSGIGLASSRELLRAAGGELSLAETSALGSVFRMTLPAAS